jgi:hypothetical protein
MSVAESNSENKAQDNLSWSTLISDAQSEITSLRDKILALRKSIVFFSKQEESGVQFPRQREKT